MQPWYITQICFNQEWDAIILWPMWNYNNVGGTSILFWQCIQEYASLKKFGDSLLSKTTKLSDLSGQLDEAILEHDQDSPHRERVKKSLAQISYIFWWIFFPQIVIW